MHDATRRDTRPVKQARGAATYRVRVTANAFSASCFVVFAEGSAAVTAVPTTATVVVLIVAVAVTLGLECYAFAASFAVSCTRATTAVTSKSRLEISTISGAGLVPVVTGKSEAVRVRATHACH